ncbi:MAG: MBL fold metallo-hydrolase [Candidatus Paceibacterota bacterium]
MQTEEKTQIKVEKKLKLTFASGATTVTGANYILETMPEEGSLEEKVFVMVDCGLVQGDADPRENAKPFPYDPAKIDYLLITHAHIDHIGRIPKFVKDGFKGKIFSTIETRELAPIMFEDAANLMLHEAEKTGNPPLYLTIDIEHAMRLWKDISYHQPFKLSGGFEVVAKDAGHILGSTMYEITYNGTKIVFTGDLGNSPSPILPNTEKITDANYLIMESVYGDRNHESTAQRRDKLEDVIEDSVRAGGALVIPSFSLEKTQNLLFEIHTLMDEGRVPSIPVFLDSPLATKVTDVYMKETKNFNIAALERIGKGEELFSFPGLTVIGSAEESKGLLKEPNPKIILAGSGMSTGGRVMHHEVNYLPDPKSTILLTGYQSFGTLGRQIANRSKTVNIFGNKIPVNARIESIDGYSSHKDSDHLLEFVSYTRDTLKKVFPVMGEPKSSMFLGQKIEDNLGVKTYHPEDGESVILSC